MADFTSPEATATRAALQAFPFVEGMVPYPSFIPDAPPSSIDYLTGLMAAEGVGPPTLTDKGLVNIWRGETGDATKGPSQGQYWSLDEPGAKAFIPRWWEQGSGFSPEAVEKYGFEEKYQAEHPLYQGAITPEQAARSVRVLPNTVTTPEGIRTVSEVTMSPESTRAVIAGQGADVETYASQANVRALETPIKGTGVKPNPFLALGRGALKTVGRVVPWASVAGGALAAEDYEAKGQDVRKNLAALSTIPGWGTIPFAAEQAINLGEWMGSPLADVPDYVDPKEIPAYICNPETWASEEELPFILNPENTLLPEQPFVRDSLGYNVRDETAR